MEQNQMIMGVVVIIIIFFFMSKKKDKKKNEVTLSEPGQSERTVEAPVGSLVTSIKLSKPTASVMNIARVQVFNNSGVDVASDRPVTSSSLYQADVKTPSRLTDSSDNSLWSGDSVFATSGREAPWVKINIVPTKIGDLDSIKISNRTDCCGDRTIGTRVELYEGSTKVSSFSWTIAGNKHYHIKSI